MSEDTSRDIVISPMLAITSRSAVFLVMVILLLVGPCYGFALQLKPLHDRLTAYEKLETKRDQAINTRVKKSEERMERVEKVAANQQKTLHLIIDALETLEP